MRIARLLAGEPSKAKKKTGTRYAQDGVEIHISPEEARRRQRTYNGGEYVDFEEVHDTPPKKR